uniref:6-hydroxymethyl-7,8-dihydropterin pyrophosphokinase n=1 Tax=Ignisphaera aggregans TaxID=334771 RepID=A0A7C4BCR4_9CREN
MYSREFISILPSFAEWWSIYLEIIKSLGIDRKLDEIATLLAYTLVRDISPPIESCRAMVMGREVVVFGAGPNLETHLKVLEEQGDLEQKILIVADGAARALVEIGFIPHIIVSDLDGDVDAIFYAATRGSKLFIHVHGDNVELFMSFVNELKRFTRSFSVTTQVEPRYPIVNVGGFTDGDRAYALALAFRPSKVLLAGMDFGSLVGRYSKPWLKSAERASPRKQAKLSIALKIISTLACKANTPTYTLSDAIPTCVKRVQGTG